ncbi:MAG: GNAT family N-acetyltransferase [Spirochaetes bacterium]|nr:GNAT family N-acetyltransferase [Spirochaetota bacterium]
MEIKIITKFDPETFSLILPLLLAQMEFIESPKNRQEIEKSMQNALKPESRALFFLLLDNNQQATGFAFANICSGIETGGDYLWLNELHIQSSHRGQGLAEKLMAHIAQWCREQKMIKILGITSVDNTKAVSFYKKHQFTVHPVNWLAKRI